MKRFLVVLIASMFLASAAYAADDMKKGDEKKAPMAEGKGDAAKTEKKSAKKATKGDKKTAKSTTKKKGEKDDMMKEDNKTK